MQFYIHLWIEIKRENIKLQVDKSFSFKWSNSFIRKVILLENLTKIEFRLLIEK